MSSFFLTATSISLTDKKTQMMAKFKYPIDRVGRIYAVPTTLTRLVTRNVGMKIFAGYGGSHGKPADDEIWEKHVLLSLERNLLLLKEYIAACKSYGDALDAMAEKEIDVEEDEKWFKSLFDEYIESVQLPILLAEESDDGRDKIKKLVSLNENVSLMIDATRAYKFFKEAKAAYEAHQKVHAEASEYKAFLETTYNNELAEASQYVSNESYYLIEWKLKSVQDIEEID